jgi:hypothetical protein
MVTIFEGSIDNDCVRYEHHSLVLFYLRNAKRHADNAIENHREGVLQSDSVSAILFSAMSVEAFLNETAESLIKQEYLEDFTFLRNQYKTRGKSSSVVKKISIIFKSAFGVDVPNNLASSVEELVILRNNLVHYKLSDAATKIIYPPLQNTKTEDGQSFMCVDFMQEPKTVMPPFVQKITGATAIRSYEIADSVLAFWNKQVEAKNNEPLQLQT